MEHGFLFFMLETGVGDGGGVFWGRFVFMRVGVFFGLNEDVFNVFVQFLNEIDFGYLRKVGVDEGGDTMVYIVLFPPVMK